MAEVVAIVASGISIAQISAQLLNCTQQLRGFCKALRDFPTEVESLLNEVEILGQIFSQLDSLTGSNCQPGATALKASLDHCRKAVTTLESLARSSREQLDQSKKSRSLQLIRVALRKDEFKEVKGQLEAAKSLLNLSVTCYSL